MYKVKGLFSNSKKRKIPFEAWESINISAKTYPVEHLTTLIHHPRSNGQAERFVDSLNRALRKAKRLEARKNFGRISNDIKCKPHSAKILG